MSNLNPPITSTHPAVIAILRFTKMLQADRSSELAKNTFAFRKSVLAANDSGKAISQALQEEGFSDNEICTIIDSLCMPFVDPHQEDQALLQLRRTFEHRQSRQVGKDYTYRGATYKR
jgi:hypothetical protein